MENTPVVNNKRGISPIWILPVIALLISGWIFYTSQKNAGIEITIYFSDASGIVPGKTQVITRGIPIGTVQKTIPDIGNKRIKTIVKMTKDVTDQLVTDTKFWIVRPQISAASIQGLDTLLSGSYINILPGKSDIYSRTFEGLSAAPPIAGDAPGLSIKLKAEKLGSIQVGSNIYYRNVPIGRVTQHYMTDKKDGIILELFIEEEHAELVREGSRFCNSSGINISGQVTNLKVQVESLASLLSGGIVLHTPTLLKDTSPVKDGHVFTLFKDLESARYGIPMTLQLASSTGITEGQTQIRYRGLVGGVVEKIEFNEDERHTVTAHILLDPRAERILRSETVFWIVRPDISTQGIENIDTLLSGPYITFTPGPGLYQNHFEILPEPPPQPPLRPGFRTLLTSDDSYSISKGAPLTYKNKKVGEILDVELDIAEDKFEILVFFYDEYKELLTPYSIFYRSGGVSVDASLDEGVTINANSLSSVLSGSISFINPKEMSFEDIVHSEHHEFFVYSSYKKAVDQVAALQPTGYRFSLKTAKPESLSVGTPILFKNVKVGEVKGFQLSRNRDYVLIDCFIFKKYEDTVNDSSIFYDSGGVNIDASLSGVEVDAGPLRSIVSGGISFYTPKRNTIRKKDAIYTLYPDFRATKDDENSLITIYFKKCDNLRKGSPIKYRGVDIGEVTNLRFSNDLQGIMVTVSVNKKFDPFFRAGTKIWMEKVKVSFSGIKNIKTAIFGPFITLQPGEGKKINTFHALTEPPDTAAEIHRGLNVTLTSKHLGSLKINSPVYYRRVKIGKVVNYSLSKNFQNVSIRINIDDPYSPIIRENTKFWFASGTRIEGGLFSGITVSTESIEALLSGGIALATPEQKEMGNSVEENHTFPLHEKAEKEWLDWEPDITLIQQEEEKEINL